MNYSHKYKYIIFLDIRDIRFQQNNCEIDFLLTYSNFGLHFNFNAKMSDSKFHNFYSVKEVDTEEFKDTIEKFKQDYLEKGWELLISLKRTMTLLTIVISYITLDSSHPFYYRATVIWPWIFGFLVLVDKIFQMNKSFVSFKKELL